MSVKVHARSMERRCFICGDTNEAVLVTHRVVPLKYGGDDSEENRVTLCANCHRAVNQIYDDGAFRRLGADADGRGDDAGGLGSFRGPEAQAVLMAISHLADEVADWEREDGIPYSEIAREADHYKGTEVQVSASKVGRVLKLADMETNRFRDGTYVVDPDAAEKADAVLGR